MTRLRLFELTLLSLAILGLSLVLALLVAPVLTVLTWFLLLGHALADYPLQSDFIARYKSRHATCGVPWPYILGAHAMVHGLTTGLLAGLLAVALGCDSRVAVFLGLSLSFGEFNFHFLIDLCKCEGLTSIHTDQALHAGCKLAGAAFICWHSGGW